MLQRTGNLNIGIAAMTPEFMAWLDEEMNYVGDVIYRKERSWHNCSEDKREYDTLDRVKAKIEELEKNDKG